LLKQIEVTLLENASFFVTQKTPGKARWRADGSYLSGLVSGDYEKMHRNTGMKMKIQNPSVFFAKVIDSGILPDR